MAVDAITLVHEDGTPLRLVLRRWLRPGWQDDDPEFTASREAAVLERLAGTGVPAPRLLAVDADGSACGVPAILMTHLAGRRPSNADEARPGRIAAMAAALAEIHAADAALRSVVGPFRPYYELARLRIPAATSRPGLWRDAIALSRDEPPSPVLCFLHRDYHPGNTIWLGRELSGIVDWGTASWGPAAVDLAHWRANLGTRHGVDVADPVLTAYAAVTGALPADQSWWDIRILLDFVDDPDSRIGNELEGHETYLAALLARRGD